MSLFFLQPEILWFLFLVIIPIVIHLLNLQKTKVVHYSNVSFLKEISNDNNKKIKLRHLFLLLSRVFFILFIVITFAQPVIKNPAQKQGNVLFLIDSSASCNDYSIGTSSIVSNSKNYIGKNKPESRTLIFAEEIGYQNIEAADQIFIVSDFQKGQEILSPKIKNDSSLNIHYLKFKNLQSNLSIDSVAVTQFPNSNADNAQIEVYVKNHDPVDQNNIVVNIIEDKVNRGSTVANIESKSVSKILLSWAYQGGKEFKVTIEDEGFKFDNSFNFCLNKNSKINISIIGDSLDLNRYNKIFSLDQKFVVNSFQSSYYNADQILNSDFVIATINKDIDPSLQNVLDRYLKAGGALFLSMNDTNSYKNYNGWGIDINKSTGGDAKKTLVLNEDNPIFKKVFENDDFSFDKPILNSNVAVYNCDDFLFKNDKGEILLGEKKVGEGILFINTIIKNQLYSNSLFLPLIYKIANSTKVLPTLYYEVGEAIVIEKEPNNNLQYTIRKDSIEMIPSYSVRNNRIFISPNINFSSAGFYELESESRKLDIAYNLSKNESVIDYISNEELENLGVFESSVSEINSENDFRKIIEQYKSGMSLWIYSLISALLFLLLEIAIIRFL